MPPYSDAFFNDDYSDPYDNGGQCQPFRSSYDRTLLNHPDVSFDSAASLHDTDLSLSKHPPPPLYFRTQCRKLLVFLTLPPTKV